MGIRIKEKEESEMTYVIDIDGTILQSMILPDGNYLLKTIDFNMVDKINFLFDDGHTIIIHTARHWRHTKVTHDQLKLAGLKYHSLVLGKPMGDFYIDDKGIKIDEFLAD